MKKGIQTRHEIKAPLPAVWNLIKTGEKWEDWLPILSGSAVSGNTRTCNVPMPDGKEDILEEIFLASDLEKTFVYQINKQQSFPATDIIGYIKLEENGTDTTMYWSVEMQVESEEVFGEINGQIRHIYSEGATKIQELASA